MGSPAVVGIHDVIESLGTRLGEFESCGPSRPMHQVQETLHIAATCSDILRAGGWSDLDELAEKCTESQGRSERLLRKLEKTQKGRQK